MLFIVNAGKEDVGVRVAGCRRETLTVLEVLSGMRSEKETDASVARSACYELVCVSKRVALTG